MARYIDSKYLVDWCNEMYQKQTQIKGKEYCNAFLQAVVTAPTADVAPKSEVAREIFDELLEKIELISIVAQPTDGFTQGVIKTFNKTSALISELKKKYTEEKE